MTGPVEPDLRVSLGSLTFKNPVFTASGTFGYGLELMDFCPPEKLGAVITKGLSLKPWPGNPAPRMAETSSGLLNSIGLENIGAEAFVRDVLPGLKAAGALVGANILGRTPAEYGQMAAKLAETAVDFIEANISCPNVAAGGLSFGADPAAAAEVTAAVRESCGPKPFLVKLTPQVSDIVAVARAVEAAGADAVSLINTLPALAVDLERRRARLGNVVGGLSGPAVKPVALRQVWLCAQALTIPVIGLGGISTGCDALEFILVGAAAVQVGTATLVDPRAPLRILAELKEWMSREGLPTLRDLRGACEF